MPPAPEPRPADRPAPDTVTADPPRPHTPSIVEHARRRSPVVTDDQLALLAFAERRDPR